MSGIRTKSPATVAAMDTAVKEVAAATARLLHALPDRMRPPPTLPRLRRPEVRARLAAKG